MTQNTRGNRRGANFTVRIGEEERGELGRLQAELGGPRALGPWLLWRALHAQAGPVDGEDLALPSSSTVEALPRRRRARAMPARARARAMPRLVDVEALPIASRTILDLCAGSGAWSEPYLQAGYRVVRVDLPRDVRTFVAPEGPIWGILAAPPCTHFSLARREPPDFVEGMACVNACLRLVLQTRPRWWALENPGSGLLGKFLGRARECFNPCDFGDAYTKRTALWGEFTRPARAYVRPKRSWGPDIGAVTPPGFARAFFEANP